NVYFTENALLPPSNFGSFNSGDGSIGRLVPGTNVITFWQVPTANPILGKLATDSSGNVYFTEGNNTHSKIGRLSPATNTISEWTLPGSIVPSDIAVDSSGNVFFSVFGPTVGRLVPTTSTITQWTIGNNPQTVAVDNSGNVFAGTSAGITRLS